jgi:tryptophan halogenase
VREPVREILIVGGGTAGWMTAALLQRRLDLRRFRVTLVESRSVGTIGVGEATVPPIVPFLRACAIDEREFMLRTNATFKLAIRFDDWLRPGASLWHPFGQIGGLIDGVPVFHHWWKRRSEGHAEGAYCDYSLQALLGERGRGPRPVTASSIVMDQGAYAFHLDASAFAVYLAGRGARAGVRHVIDDVRGVALDERGFVRHVETAEHGPLAADLFVDCSGFRGLLIEQQLGDPWIDWSDTLLCDRAVTLPLPRDPAMPPFTRSTAAPAGWIWRIPLQHRTGTGYVYSSRFVSDDDAARALVAHSGPDAERETPRALRMRVGRRTRFWVGNCVSIGLAAGFVEPLESTGLFLIQAGVEQLIEHFPDRDMSPRLAAAYDERMAATFDEVRDFIVLHYALSGREDTPFWKASRTVPLPDALRERLALYDETALLPARPHALFAETSWHAILAGFERLPQRSLARAHLSNPGRVAEILASIRAHNADLAASLPSHATLLGAITAPPRGALGLG